jgi:UPF0755 protein
MPGTYKKILKICAVALIAFLFAGGGIFLLRGFNKAPEGEIQSVSGISFDAGTNTVIMEITGGESADAVGGRLEEARLIKTRRLWSALCRIDRSFLKAGVYQFNTGLSLRGLHKLFVEGKQMRVPVTIPEGWTIKKIARLLEEAGVSAAGDFIISSSDKNILEEYNIAGGTAEGYLYPDTYFFTARYPAEKVVRTMLDNFYKKLAALNIDVYAMEKEELRKGVILASIIEREYRARSEAPVMAGVFQNRIELGMKLESCATVEYIITEIEGKAHPTRIFFSDLEIVNPYNTYLFKGLPPGPISSPGETALQAAFFPLKNEYLFFRLLDPSAGRHHFSKTFDDHLKAGLAEFFVKGY